MTYSNTDLPRFLDAQNKLYLTAFSEIKKRQKRDTLDVAYLSENQRAGH